jgi:hypothetical protein
MSAPAELMNNGQPCPDYVQKILSGPGALRARAAIRRQIADQDQAWGDTLAAWRNLQIAETLEARAREIEGG